MTDYTTRGFGPPRNILWGTGKAQAIVFMEDGTLRLVDDVLGSTPVDMAIVSPNGTLELPGFAAAAMALPSYTKAGLPAAGNVGRLARVTDTTRGVWMDQGTQWFSLSARVINVMEFGAKGDGTTDDTAAIQSALDAVPQPGGAVVELPPLKFKVTSALNVRNGTCVRGAVNAPGLNQSEVYNGTLLDASISFPAATGGVLQAIEGNQYGIKVEALTIRMLQTPGADLNAISGKIGIRFFSTSHIVIRDVNILHGNNGIVLQASGEAYIENTRIDLVQNRGLSMYNASAVVVSGGVYSNCGQSNLVTNGNLYVGGVAGQTTQDVIILNAHVDEGAHASVNIGPASHIVFMGGRVFTSSINSNGVGPGYGFKLGEPTDSASWPTNVTIVGARVESFAGGAITNTILINGSQHKLLGVTTVPSVATGDILDNAGDTVGIVNGGVWASAAKLTMASGTGITVNKGAEVRRVTYKSTFDFTAFQAAAATKDVTVGTLPAKARLVGVVVDVTVPFTGTSAGVTATLGKTAGGNEYLVSFDVKSATITRGNADADLGASINRASAVQGGDLPSWSATTAVSMRMTSAGTNLSNLAAGSLTVYLTTEVMP